MTNRSSLMVCAAAGLALLTSPVCAQDKSPLDGSYVAIKATFGIGGSRIVESDAVSFAGVTARLTDSAPFRRKDNLDLSYGISGQYMVALHRYFALGGLLGVMSWQSSSADSDADRNLGFDLAVVPQGKLPVTDTVELYIALPLGLALNSWSEVAGSVSIGTIQIAKSEANTAVGFAVSLLAGVRLALVDNFGLFTELGFTHRQFAHEVTLSIPVVAALGTAKANADLTLDQFAWNIGAFF